MNGGASRDFLVFNMVYLVKGRHRKEKRYLRKLPRSHFQVISPWKGFTSTYIVLQKEARNTHSFPKIFMKCFGNKQYGRQNMQLRIERTIKYTVILEDYEKRFPEMAPEAVLKYIKEQDDPLDTEMRDPFIMDDLEVLSSDVSINE